MTAETKSIEIRRARLEDAGAIQDFIHATYSGKASQSGPDRWRWQYVDAPFRPGGDHGPASWIALEGDRVVGQIAVQDGTLWLDGAPLDAGWIVDVMVRPEWRGHGLGHRIHAAVMQDRAVLITLTMAEATRRIAERAGCLTLGAACQIVRPHRLSPRTVRRFLAQRAFGGPLRVRGIGLFNASGIGPAALAWGARAASLGSGWWRRWAHRMRNRTQDQSGTRIEEVARFPEAIDALWLASREARGAVFERSARFLNWRFVDVPDLVYRRFVLWRGGDCLGYVVTRLSTPDELSTGIIADLYAHAGDTATLDALLAHATSILAPHSEYLDAGASSPDTLDVLRRAGFIATRRHRPTIVVTDPALRARLSRYTGPWHYTKADHDWDQVHVSKT